MSTSRLEVAKQLIQEKKYDAARSLLLNMPESETARKWLARLDEIAPASSDTSTQLARARQLLQEKRYSEARTVLEQIDHPTADKWLERLNEIDDPFKAIPESSHRTAISNEVPVRYLNDNGHIARHLIKGEQIVFKTKHHWAVLVIGIIRGIIYGAFMGFLFGLLIPSTSSASAAPAFAVMCASFMGLIIFVVGLTVFLTSEYAVTTKRVVAKTGFIIPRTFELNLNHVESCSANTSLIGLILGFKDLSLAGSGGTRKTFRSIANAEAFRNHVIERMSVR